MNVPVTRLPIHLRPDPARVITRYFGPGDEQRIRRIIDRVLAIPASDADALLASVERDFRPTHPDVDAVFLQNFEVVKHHVPDAAALSDDLRRLIGACFTMEYAVEAAALFNPSMAPAVDQDGVPPGSVRFLMSLRATGEGHLSSIVFRRGLIDAQGGVSVDPPGRYSRALAAIPADSFDKPQFVRELQTLGAWNDLAQKTMALVGERFTRAEFVEAIGRACQQASAAGQAGQSTDALLALTQANYQLTLPPGGEVSELVIFPFSDNERRGIEDMRLVRFTDDDGSSRYYGAYTAYDGVRIYPQLLEYGLGESLEVRMLSGNCAKNKGMALFPRRIAGKYAMVARLDNENLYYMESDDVHFWDSARLLQTPRFPWEVIQIGNCGPPLETDSGWLLLTHGVGPVRQYCIGVTLLDRDDPTRVIGQSREPLIAPVDQERRGYVPNVVYSCGGMIHNGLLVLPYATSDSATTIAVVELDALLKSLLTD